MAIFGIVPLVLTVTSWLVQIVLAFAVLSDSPPRRVLVGNGVWAMATLVGGIFVAAAYWALHHGLPTVNRHAAVIPTAE